MVYLHIYLPILGGGNSNIFGMFIPIPGEMIPIQFDWRIFFQMGWFNRQLVMDVYRSFFVFCIDKIYIMIYITSIYRVFFL